MLWSDEFMFQIVFGNHGRGILRTKEKKYHQSRFLHQLHLRTAHIHTIMRAHDTSSIVGVVSHHVKADVCTAEKSVDIRVTSKYFFSKYYFPTHFSSHLVSQFASDPDQLVTHGDSGALMLSWFT